MARCVDSKVKLDLPCSLAHASAAVLDRMGLTWVPRKARTRLRKRRVGSSDACPTAPEQQRPGLHLPVPALLLSASNQSHLRPAAPVPVQLALARPTGSLRLLLCEGTRAARTGFSVASMQRAQRDDVKGRPVRLSTPQAPLRAPRPMPGLESCDANPKDRFADRPTGCLSVVRRADDENRRRRLPSVHLPSVHWLSVLSFWTA